MRSIKKLFIMLIILSICTTTIAMARDTGGNATPADTATTNVTSTPAAIVTQAQVPTTVVTAEKEKKFRVGPTVKIRPLNDEINKSTDGLIEIYMDNPSLNDVTLNFDARISVPSGIHVYGQGFGEAGAAGTVYGTFSVPPGKARTIYITIKAEKAGDFNTQFSGMYYPDDNKDEYQPISLTHPFRVTEASSNPKEASSPQQTNKIPGMTTILAIFSIIIVAYRLRRI